MEDEKLIHNDSNRFVVLHTYEEARKLGNALGQLGMKASAEHLFGQLDSRSRSLMGNDSIDPPIHLKKEGIPGSLLQEIVEV